MSRAPSSLDPMEQIRSHPHWFFPSGDFEVETLLGLLVAEATTSDAVSSVEVRHIGDWWLFQADGDWLDGDLTAFSSLVPVQEAGDNQTRVEAVVMASCPVVVTAVAGREQTLTAPGSPPEELIDVLRRRDAGRTLMFQVRNRRSTGSEVAPTRDDQWSELWHSFSMREQEFNDV